MQTLGRIFRGHFTPIALCCACLVWPSCKPATVSLTELQYAMDDFGRGIRWKDYSRAVAYMAPESARALQAADQNDDLRVSNISYGRLARDNDTTVRTTLSIDWYRISQGRLHRTVVQQIWRNTDDKWHITEQRWLRGPPLPLLSTTSGS